jgi:tetratricopeptide (TPR) repeat protein
MSFMRWFRSKFTSRGKALWHYRQGMELANEQNHQEAIEAYSFVIEMRGGPPDVQAMARYNRALVYATLGDQTTAIGDLEVVLSMRQALPEIKAAARQRLHRMQRQTDRSKI